MGGRAFPSGSRFEVGQLAEVRHYGKIATEGVGVAQDGHHLKTLVDQVGVFVKM